MNDRIFTMEEIKSLVKPIAEKYQVQKIYLFGSYARGNAIKFNDSGRRTSQKRLRDELIQRFIRRRPVPLRLLTK